jgi:transposase InsO family protein
MPWQELSRVAQREEFVRLALAAEANVSELCRRFGISRSKGYKWLARYRAEGAGGLCDRSRRPKLSPKRTAAVVEDRVLAIRAASNGAWGGRKIARVLRNKGGSAPSASTITAILRRNGKLAERNPEHPGPYRRFERAEPNELWQMDFKGDFAIANGRCHALTILDDHSRYALGLLACANQQEATARQALVAVFRRYGLPLAMLMDNGSPWGTLGGEHHTRFTVWLMRLGIKVSHGRPYHPQTQGKDERFHRSLEAEELAGRSFADLAHCQQAFDRWRPVYNTERPHQALDFAVPADRYRMSQRPYPEALPEIDYAASDIVRKTDCTGKITFRNQAWRIGRGFCGERVALRATNADGLLTVHYGAHQIGGLDLNSGAIHIGRGHSHFPVLHRLSTANQQQQIHE